MGSVSKVGKVGTRRAIAALAGQHGLGRVVRVHRLWPKPPIAPWLTAATLIGVLAAGMTVFGLTLEQRPEWRWPVLAWAVLAGTTVAVHLWGPTDNAHCRIRLVTTEHGLLIWTPDRPDTPIAAIPWAEVHLEPSAFRTIPRRITWQAGGDGGEQQHFAGVGIRGRRDLYRAIERGAPVGAWPWQRAAGVAIAGLCTLLIGWFAGVPVALDLVLGEQPHDVDDLSRICEGGNAYRRLPASAGTKHPLVLFKGDRGGDYDEVPAVMLGLRGGPSTPPSPDAVQLVACSRLVGQASPGLLDSCDYRSTLTDPAQGAYTENWYQGRDRVEVFEARTGRKVEAMTIDGDPAYNCVEGKIVGAGTPQDSDFETRPRDRDYAARLRPLVGR